MIRNSLISLQGTLIAQGIGFLFMPVLTRLYSPDDFATYQLYLSVLMIVMTFVSLRYEMAILGSRSLRETAALFRLSGLSIAVVSVVAGMVAVVLSWLRPVWLHLPDAVLWLVAASILAGGFFQMTGFVLLREQALADSAVAKIAQVVVFCLAALVAVGAGASTTGLPAADLVGRGVAAGYVVWWIARKRRPVLDRVSVRDVVDAARSHRRFPIYAVPSALVAAATSSGVPLAMAAAFGNAAMGQYVLVERTVLAPAGLLGQSVAQAFTAHLSDAVARGEPVSLIFRKVLAIMALIATVPTVLLVVAGPWLFRFVFGEPWTVAGEMARAAAVLFFTSLVAAPVNMTLVVIGQPQRQLVLDLLRSATVVAVWAGILVFHVAPVEAITIHAVALSAMMAAFVVVSERACRSVTAPSASPGTATHAGSAAEQDADGRRSQREDGR